MIKKLLALSTVLAGAALLQNKERRERLTQQAQSFLKGARERLSQGQNQGSTSEQSAERSEFGSPSGAGATTRTGMGVGATPPRNGIY
jgi:hypothetical protein